MDGWEMDLVKRVLPWVSLMVFLLTGGGGFASGAQARPSGCALWAAIPAPTKSGHRDLGPHLFLGQEETFVLVRPGGGRQTLALGVEAGRPAALWDAPARAAWDLQRALVDVAGDGHLREVEWGPNDRWAPALTGGRGAERLTWTNTWGDEGRTRRGG